MDFDSRLYFRAGVERLREARYLYPRSKTESRPESLDVLGIYVAGLAVECVFRAFILEMAKIHNTPGDFDARHDLILLYRKSRMWELPWKAKASNDLSASVVERIKRELDAEVDTANRLWRNSYRYYSHQGLRSSLHERGLDRGIKGDFVKENFARMLSAATTIINRGELIWQAWTR